MRARSLSDVDIYSHPADLLFTLPANVSNDEVRRSLVVEISLSSLSFFALSPLP